MANRIPHQGFDGSTTIVFRVRRSLDPASNLPRSPSDKEKLSSNLTQEFDLSIEGRSFYQPGRLTGAYDDCYPDDGGTEILGIAFMGTPWAGTLSDEESLSALRALDHAISGCDHITFTFDIQSNEGIEC